jgi:carbonic anhydrase
MKSISSLMDGYRVFRSGTFPAHRQLYRELVERGQSPRVMIVSCCDSRVDPAVILSTKPGELFMARNVANLVPPYEPHGDYHGTSAALEFAVSGLQVEHVIVLGHAYCGGVKAFLDGHYGADGNPESHFIAPWMSLLRPAMKRLASAGILLGADDRQRALEQASVVNSLANLETFPFVQEKLKAGTLALHGAWFDIERGLLMEYDGESGSYAPL